MKQFAVLFVLLCVSATAQHLSVGLKGGWSLTDPFDSYTTTTAGGTVRGASEKSFLLGPMLEVRLPFGLAAEADLLYHPLTQDISTTSATGSIVHSTDTHSSWEFPILAKVKLPTPILKPYVEGGVAFRHVFNDDLASSKGFVLGAGIDIHALVLHIGPELRFIHWTADSRPTGAIPPFTSQNQVQFLIGVSF